MNQKYTFLREIGDGSQGTVYLAEHKQLHVKRIIKILHHTQSGQKYFLREATLLKFLSHPAIPCIYDCGETSEITYIIEEYMDGISLKALQESQKTFSQRQIFHIAIKLCEIVSYLHDLRPYPLLYLDLKPEHIILDKDQVRLIDLGAAVLKKGESISGTIMGTIGFASPEQQQGKKLDEKTDIYSIGALLFWMATGETINDCCMKEQLEGKPVGFPTRFWDIICRCLEECAKDRYLSVAALEKELNKQNKEHKESYWKKSLIIAVSGSRRHIGVTHLAIAITVYLNQLGYSCLYEEKNESGALQQTYHYNKRMKEKNGVYHMGDFRGIPQYGKAIQGVEHEFPIIVQDYGSENRERIVRADYQIMVLGAREWEIKCSSQILKKFGSQEGCVFLFNARSSVFWEDEFKRLGLSGPKWMPWIDNPFHIEGKERKFFQKLLAGFLKVRRGRSLYEWIQSWYIR